MRDLQSIRLGDYVVEMAKAGETQEEQDAVIVAAFRFTAWGEDCHERCHISAREWAVLTREQTRLNPPKRELSQAQLEQRRKASKHAGAPLGNRNAGKAADEQKQSETIGTIGPSKEREEKREEKTENENETETRATRARFGENPKSNDFDLGITVAGFALKGTQADAMRAELRAGEEEAIAVALKWTGETGDRHAENTLRKLRRQIGSKCFEDAVLTADAEARAGEEPRNRGAALVARMKTMIQPPSEAVAGFSAKMGVANDA